MKLSQLRKLIREEVEDVMSDDDPYNRILYAGGSLDGDFWIRNPAPGSHPAPRWRNDRKWFQKLIPYLEQFDAVVWENQRYSIDDFISEIEDYFEGRS